MRNISIIIFAVLFMALFPGCESTPTLRLTGLVITQSFDRPPMPISVPIGTSKTALAGQREGGWARVSFDADAEGHVVDAKILNATTPEFGRMAVELIGKTVFSPGFVKDVPIPFTGAATYRFSRE